MAEAPGHLENLLYKVMLLSSVCFDGWCNLSAALALLPQLPLTHHPLFPQICNPKNFHQRPDHEDQAWSH